MVKTILPDHMVCVWPYGVWLESLEVRSELWPDSVFGVLGWSFGLEFWVGVLGRSFGSEFWVGVWGGYTLGLIYPVAASGHNYLALIR